VWSCEQLEALTLRQGQAQSQRAAPTGSNVGAESIVRAGACVKQRDRFGDRSVVDGFPAGLVETLTAPPSPPSWALPRDEVAALRRWDRQEP
jgi:carbonic anhydrase/acetyltransferase-like protein (isoleucine patch superfamily)